MRCLICLELYSIEAHNKLVHYQYGAFTECEQGHLIGDKHHKEWVQIKNFICWNALSRYFCKYKITPLHQVCSERPQEWCINHCVVFIA